MKLPKVKKRLKLYWSDSGVKTKTFLILFLGITVPILTSNYITFKKASSQIENLVVDAGFINTHTHAMYIQQTINSYKKTVVPLGGSAPIKGYNVALNSGGKDSVPGFGLTMGQWKKSIEDMFSSILNFDTSYSQLRYINRDGYEVARVEYANEGVVITPEEQLQYKGDRYYITEGSLVPTETVFLSELDLNKEGTPPVVSTPITPTIRFVTPVVSITSSGEFFGTVVANIHRDKIFESLTHKTGIFNDHAETTYVIDSDGFFLLHPDSSKEFGGPNDLNTGITIKDELPSLAKKLLSGKSGAEAYKGSLIAYAPVYPYENKENFWVVIEIAPKDVALSSVYILEDSLYVLLFGFLGVMGVAFFILSNIAQDSIEDTEEVIETLQSLR